MQRITPLLPRRGLLFQSLVLTYYRQNAGQLGFLFFIMFLAVGRANQAGLLEYHESLIRGMLTNPSIFCLVLLAWLIYTRKCARFIVSILQKPEFTFLYETPQLGTPKAYARLLQVQTLLFLPVLLYVLCIVNVGIREHYYWPTALVIIYNVLLCTLSAAWYLRLLRFPTSSASPHPLLTTSIITSLRQHPFLWRLRQNRLFKFPTSYSRFLLRYLLTTRKTLTLVIKVYNCGILYLMLKHNAPETAPGPGTLAPPAATSPASYDWQMILLFYSFGLLGHGVLIHLLKGMEKRDLDFYPGLPLSLTNRFVQYAAFYAILLLPELFVIIHLTPTWLHYTDALFLLFLSLTTLLLLNSILLYPFPRMIDYLKIVGLIFLVIYLGVMTSLTWCLPILSLGLSIVLFRTRYYKAL